MYATRFSPEAKSAGAIGNILLDTQETEIAEQLAKQEAQKLNGTVATYSGSAIKSALNDQATATRSNGIADITAGAVQGGAELGAAAYESGISGTKADNEKLENINKWQDAIDNAGNEKKAGQAGLIAAAKPPELSPEKLTEAKGRVGGVTDVTGPIPEGMKEDLAAVKRSQDVSRKEDDCLDRLQNTVTRQKKEVEGRIETDKSRCNRRAANLRAAGNMTFTLSKGVGSMYAAKAQAEQAEDEAIKTQAQFASDSSKGNVDAINKDLDNKKSVKDSTNQLLSGLIQENRA